MVPEPQVPPTPPQRRFSLGWIVIPGIYAFFILRAIVKIAKGDIAGQVELAAVVAVTLLVALPVVLLARLLSKSAFGRFLHADTRTARILNTRRLIVEIREEPNAFLVFPALILISFLLIAAIGGIVALVRWIVP